MWVWSGLLWSGYFKASKLSGLSQIVRTGHTKKFSFDTEKNVKTSVPTFYGFSKPIAIKGMKN